MVRANDRGLALGLDPTGLGVVQICSLHFRQNIVRPTKKSS